MSVVPNSAMTLLHALKIPNITAALHEHALLLDRLHIVNPSWAVEANPGQLSNLAYFDTIIVFDHISNLF